MYEAKVQRCINGITIHIGCHMWVFNDIEDGMNQLRIYYEDPVRAIKDWQDRLEDYQKMLATNQEPVAEDPATTARDPHELGGAITRSTYDMIRRARAEGQRGMGSVGDAVTEAPTAGSVE